MNIDITRLKNHAVSKIDINESYSLNEEDLKKANILKLDDIQIIGSIVNVGMDEYNIDVTVEGVMELADSITLEPIKFPFQTEISGNIGDLLEEINEISKKSQFSIDIFPIIWENILMEIPIRVVGENRDKVSLEGEGWKFVQSEEVSLNPELEKLKSLLNEK